MLAVQWHPEWRLAENPDSVKLFSWFGTVIRGASFDEAAARVARYSVVDWRRRLDDAARDEAGSDTPHVLTTENSL